MTRSTRESDYFILYQQDLFIVMFVNSLFLQYSRYFSREKFSDWRITVVIDKHEKSTTHLVSARYWIREHSSRYLICEIFNSQTKCRVDVTVIVTISRAVWLLETFFEAFYSCYVYVRGTKIGFLLELMSQFDLVLTGHISKWGNSGQGIPSYRNLFK